MSQSNLTQPATSAADNLAKSMSRKLALLIGINAYPQFSLRGCLNDVDLQRELLVHRFGFHPSDVLCLKNEQATRQGILTAFEDHLINQVKPGDVVVFHFSGHGSRVVDPDPVAEWVVDGTGFNGTLVPYDRAIDNSHQVRDIMGKTLFLLMSALQTDFVTMVLDCCFSGGTLRGNYQVRSLESRLGNHLEQASAEEFAYQEQWLSRLGWTPAIWRSRRNQGIAKGVAMGAARPDQLALDVPFSGFHAGAFTYLLTRYLWQQPFSQSLDTTFANLALSTKTLADRHPQDPAYAVQPASQHGKAPVYFLEQTQPAAEAIVQEASGKEQISFWLGGVSPQSLISHQQGARFTLLDAQGNGLGEVEQTERMGLVGYGKLHSETPVAIQPGMRLREQVRGLPTNLALQVGLAPSLGDDRAAAWQALQSIQRVQVLTVDQTQELDYLLERTTPETLQQLALDEAGLLLENCIGLFTPGLTPVPDSFGAVGESVERAIARLRPRLKSLLAGRLLRAILNTNTSPLKVSAEVILWGQCGLSQALYGTIASRGARVDTISNQQLPHALSPGAELKVRVTNEESRSLYLAVLVIGSNGDLSVLYPVGYDAPIDASLIQAGKALLVPESSDRPEQDFQFVVEGSAGCFELLIVASQEPLRDALKGLAQIARNRGLRSGDPLLGLEEDESLLVVNALLRDIDRMTRATLTLKQGIQAIAISKFAALSTVIEVAESSCHTNN